MTDLVPGEVVWVAPGPAVGRELAGRRPGVVISGHQYLDVVESLAIVVPITTVDRGWPNHVSLRDVGLPQPSWAMTEQVRMISRARIVDRAGRVNASTLHGLRVWELRANLGAYDAAYVALAELLDAPLYTADLRLSHVTGARCTSRC